MLKVFLPSGLFKSLVEPAERELSRLIGLKEKEKTKQVLLLGKKSSTSKSFSTLKSEKKVETLEFDENELKSKFEKRWIMKTNYNKCNNHLFL